MTGITGQNNMVFLTYHPILKLESWLIVLQVVALEIYVPLVSYKYRNKSQLSLIGNKCTLSTQLPFRIVIIDPYNLVMI